MEKKSLNLQRKGNIFDIYKARIDNNNKILNIVFSNVIIVVALLNDVVLTIYYKFLISHY